MPTKHPHRRVPGHVPIPADSPALALHHAIDAVIWGTPLVSVDAMREAFFRDAGAAYGDVLYWSEPADWKLQLTTPNASARYAFFPTSTAAGPMILDIPPAIGAGLFGSITDAWQVPLADVGPQGGDRGRGGLYVLIPPRWEGPLPRQAFPVRATTFNGYCALRAIPEGVSDEAVRRAIDLLHRVRVYSLAQIDHPPPQRTIDMSGTLFDGIVRFDDSFFGRLARMLDEEPTPPDDGAILDHLRTLGIQKGRPYAPDAAMRALFAHAARTARDSFITAIADDGTPYWPNRRWRAASPLGARSAFTFRRDDGSLDARARALTYFLACAPPAKLGKATFYLSAFVDRSGRALRGDRTYRLHVPAHVPAAQFWAATVYDRESAAFIEGSPRVEISSYASDLVSNPDDSVDLYFGPEPPAGHESNWVYTSPKDGWFTIFRCYGPTDSLFDRTWQLTDLELSETYH